MKKILTAYYSWPNGNAERITKMFHKKIGGDIVGIDTVAHYDDSCDDVVNQGQKEVQRGYEPEIKPIGFDVSEYDAIVEETPVYTFLERYDFFGKKIQLFCMHEGGGLFGTERNIAKAAKDAAVEKGLNIYRSSAYGTKNIMKGWL